MTADTHPIRVGILDAWRMPHDIADELDSEATMIRSMLGEGFACTTYDVIDAPPPAPVAEDAFIVTGSSASAYSEDAWVVRLKSWLGSLDRALPVIGICFGHQLMAAAHGGCVERSVHGTIIGLHAYALAETEAVKYGVRSITLPVVHYDQVIKAPHDTKIIAGSALCPVGALFYTERRAMSFQAHPELDTAYLDILIERQLRRGALTDAAAQAARQSLLATDDRNLVGAWIRDFLRDSGPRRI